MACSRSIPTQLFWEPAFSLLDSDTQIILLRLSLIADDEGRGLEQIRFLVRQFDKDANMIKKALTTLNETEFLTCYQIENQQYYQHLHWQEWETLSKPIPSRYPAPPASSHPGGDVYKLSLLLGHSSVTMAENYLKVRADEAFSSCKYERWQVKKWLL